MKTTAFDYASMLMRPEYRKSISEQYKRKIENIVRKPEKCDEEEPMSECPFCKVKGPETELECNSCKNVVPYCIATGTNTCMSERDTRREGVNDGMLGFGGWDVVEPMTLRFLKF